MHLLLRVMMTFTVPWMAVQASASICPALPDGAPEPCVASAEGWFYAETEAATMTMAADARATAELFRRHFGRAAPNGAIVALGGGTPLTAAQEARLHASGAGTVRRSRAPRRPAGTKAGHAGPGPRQA